MGSRAPAPDDRFAGVEDVLTAALERDDEQAVRAVSRREALLGRLVARRELTTLVVCLLLFAFFTAGNPRYASPDILIGIARRIAPIGIMAVGMTFLLIAGELDLSIGAIFGFGAVLLGELASQEHRDPWLSSLVVLLVCTALGGVNAVLVTRFGLASFIATLGMLAGLRGASNAITGGVGTYAKDTDQLFYVIMSGNVPGTRIPDSFVIMAVIMAIGAVVLAATKFGSDVYATGGNAEAARNNGIRTRHVKFACFVLMGLLCGIAGVMQFGWLQYAPGNTGVGIELQVIAATIIGGVGLFGGRGTVLGSLLGGLILAMLTSGLVMIGMRDYWDGVAAGVVIVVSVGLEQLVRGGASRSLSQVVQARS
jgi:ribose transport system permease protein